MFSAGAASALGFVFWAFTAHRLDASAVGSVSAEVSSIMFLAAVGSLNLSNIFARFLPVAGRYARRLVLISYGGARLGWAACCHNFLADSPGNGTGPRRSIWSSRLRGMRGVDQRFQ